MLERLRRARYLYAVNGAAWLAVFLAVRASQTLFGERLITTLLYRSLARIERRRRLPGSHTVAINRHAWESYDWGRGGEEWSVSPEWKADIVDRFMAPYCSKGTALEIGSGAGRWTLELRTRSDRVVAVDISLVLLAALQKRIGRRKGLLLTLGDGQSLSFARSGIFDFVWSFDVFVHVSIADTRAYIGEIGRVMRPGAIAVIHHPHDATMQDGWRSSVTSADVDEFLGEHGLLLLRREIFPGDNADRVPRQDAISIFQKP